MEKIIYRGSNNFIRVECPSRNVYEFNQTNKYTVKPLTHEDFYFILLLDNNPIHRNFVVESDPKKVTNERRIYVDTTFINPDLIKKQEENEARERKEKLYESFKKKFIDDLFNKVALGAIDPETKEAYKVEYDYEQQAEEYAREEMNKIEEDKLEIGNTEQLDNEGGESGTEKDLSKMGFAELLEEAKNLSIDVPDDIKSKKGVIELINKSKETPVIEDVPPIITDGEDEEDLNEGQVIADGEENNDTQGNNEEKDLQNKGEGLE